MNIMYVELITTSTSNINQKTTLLYKRNICIDEKDDDLKL